VPAIDFADSCPIPRPGASWDPVTVLVFWSGAEAVHSGPGESPMRMLSASTLDSILTLQLFVAWAGESSRLGWWNTNLVDPDAGLDLLHRLAPRTAALAGWELVRAAAIATDAERRAPQAERDRMVTLFHLGVDLDEALADRLRELKMSGATLADLPSPDAPFDRAAFAARLSALGAVDAEPRAAGRKIKGPPPVEPLVRAQHLAAALVPLADHYPLPYYA
jgi:hypothetical protein